MRIIAGKLRGLKLNTPPGLDTRPTLDRVKEAIFSMLMPYLNDANILDLFAGTGALGIEAISRGASRADFVDISKDAIEHIKKNISLGRISDVSTVYNKSAVEFLRDCNKKYDLIFLDPPYFSGVYSDVLSLISEKKLLNENGLIIAEWDYENGFTENVSSFCVFKEKKYGRVGVTVLKWGLTE